MPPFLIRGVMMKKNILCFFAGAVITFVILVSFTAFNNYKKENLPDVQQIANAYSELDMALFIRADKRFNYGDFKGSLEDMKTRETIRKVIHSKNELYLKQEDEAVDCLTKLVELNEKIKKNPNDYKLYYERANLRNKPKISLFDDDEQSFCSDPKSAISDFSKVIELKPDFKYVYERRADATGMSMNGISYKSSEKEKYDKLFKENFQQMISDYEKAAEFNVASKELPLKLAGCYYNDEQYEKALELFKEVSKSDREGYLGMAISYYKLEQYQNVVESLNQYETAPKVLQNPVLPEPESCCKAIYLLRAKANFKLHRYSDWLKDLKKAGF